MNRLWFENGGLDQIDAELLATLATDGRITIADLARKVGMSPPSVAERIKRLEEAQVILGYGARINPAALGLPLAVHIRVRPMPGQLGKLAALLNKLPAIVECDRITSDDCFVARAHVASVQELEKLIDQIIPRRSNDGCHLFQGSPDTRRLPRQLSGRTSEYAFVRNSSGDGARQDIGKQPFRALILALGAAQRIGCDQQQASAADYRIRYETRDHQRPLAAARYHWEPSAA